MTKKTEQTETFMTPERFVEVNQELFGERSKDWRKAFLKLTGFNASVVTRYVKGEVTIPLHIVNLLLSLRTLVWYGDDVKETFELGEEQA